MPQRASSIYARPASIVFLPSDQDSTIDLSTAASNVHYRTGGGWTGTRTITVEGTPADGSTVVVSNNSGQSIELANGTGVPLDVGTLPLVIRNGEWVGLVTSASTSKLVDVTGAVGLDVRGDLSRQNTVTVAQISDPENLNAAQLGSASATDGYVLKADGSGGTAWEAGAAAVPAEVTLTPATTDDWRYLDQTTDTMEPTTAPASAPATNVAREASAYTVTDGTIGSAVTLFGVEGRVYNMIHSYRVMEVATITETIANGEDIYFCVLAGKDTNHAGDGGGGTDHFRLYLNEPVADEIFWYADASTGNVVTTGGAFGTVGLTVPTTANDAINGATLVGTYTSGDAGNGGDLYLLQFKLTATQEITTDLTFGVSSSDDSDNPFPVIALYAGKGPIDLLDSGDLGKVLLPGASTTTTVTLDASDPHAPYQVVTLSSDATLVLPSAPAGGEPPRTTRLRVEGSGNLTMPSSARLITGSGSATTLAAPGRVEVEQRPTGDPDLILASFDS